MSLGKVEPIMNADETALRLQETAAKCLSSLDAWNKDLKDDKARETLLEAVHELRKVTSRLEIDIAMNDRKALNAKPLPIPEHKSKTEKKKKKPLSDILPVAEIRDTNEKKKIAIKDRENDHDDDNETSGLDSDDDSNAKDEKSKKPRRKKRDTKNSSD
jgi:hypothetical protein